MLIRCKKKRRGRRGLLDLVSNSMLDGGEGGEVDSGKLKGKE